MSGNEELDELPPTTDNEEQEEQEEVVQEQDDQEEQEESPPIVQEAVKKRVKKKKVKEKEESEFIYIDEEDLIKYENPAEHSRASVLSKRQDFFVQSAVTGQFTRTRDTEKVLALMLQNDDDSEVNDDELDKREVANVGNLRLQIVAKQLNENLFLLSMFTEGLLAGLCLFHLIITAAYVQSISSSLTWMGSASQYIQKLHTSLVTLCLVMNLSIAINQIKPVHPNTSVLVDSSLTYDGPFHRSVFAHHQRPIDAQTSKRYSDISRKGLLLLKVIMYIATFIATWVSASQEDYFSVMYASNNSWFQSTTDATTPLTRFIVYQVFNMARNVLGIIAWITGACLWMIERKYMMRNQRTLQIYHQLYKQEEEMQQEHNTMINNQQQQQQQQIGH
ncbi:tmem5 [Acrasis kona]|uniref:Tmem5 n=1 Tax=Acrasis kona TaxID=1008807 RepID=A0AAW2YT32_9EUKA